MSEWNHIRMKYLVGINERSLDEDGPANREFRYIDISTVGRGFLVSDPVRISFGDAPSRARRLVRTGDTIVSTVRTYLRAVWPVSGNVEDLVVSTGFAVLTPRHVDPGFLGWWAQSTPFIEAVVSRSVGVGYPAINASEIGDLYMPVPPLDEQKALVNYLAAETARIDTLFAKKQQLIELFRARANALVEVVTGSLRGRYNEVPLKYLVREIDQRLGDRTPPEMLSVSIHYGVAPRSQVTDKPPRAEELSAYKMCDRDDIVLNRMRAFQGGVGRSPQAGIVSPDYTVLRPSNLVLSRYLHYIFRSPWFIGEMTARLRGIGDSDQGNVRTPRINFAELGLIRVPLPSLTIQAELADTMDREIAKTTTITEKLAQQINLLREHRQALITAAVIGKLEIPVPEAVA